MSDTTSASTTPTGVPPTVQSLSTCSTAEPPSLFTAAEWQQMTNDRSGVSPARVTHVIARSVRSEASRTSLLSEMDPTLRWTLKCTHCLETVTLRQAEKGIVIEALDRLWHREHFTCVKCAAPLGAANMDFRPFGPYGDSAVCLECYMDTYHPKCASCEQPLRETCVEAQGKRWHQSCFKCRRCTSPIGGDEYYIWEDRVFDRDCFFLRRYRSVMQGRPGSEPPSPAQNAFTTDSSSSASVPSASSSGTSTTSTSTGSGSSTSSTTTTPVVDKTTKTDSSKNPNTQLSAVQTAVESTKADAKPVTSDSPSAPAPDKDKI